VNEAFAPQYLAVERELGLDRSRTNVAAARLQSGTRRGDRHAHHHSPAARPAAREEAVWPRLACIGGGQGAP